ncbi:hypothetical protein G647_06420 [Cladophialophora carrionii CBS 160.54]|uniref:Histone chaperone RTT106/FACT complex subunit SPT16-like middle domain-containing protein n=1 Tax=Cladophialophora carrionii CBS 160.54 TaxID=1279043 RepID=V9D6R0_9EURO|nr:uncharacterized protein G647_06420 [Cladophialophora carrionii CBS 160.54]ETI22346.1 hypothetical protein G647_06420 [Cladophialophora carrionii CBS 160.54]
MSGRDTIDRAFARNSSLRKRVFEAIDATPQHAPLFEDIANYHLTSLAEGGVDDEPASKRRKFPNGGGGAATTTTTLPITPAHKDQPREVVLEARDISFSLPQRKKLHLGIAQYGTDINAAETSFAIFTRNPATNEVDMEVPFSQFAYALRLPVPEKAAKQYNFVLVPRQQPGSSTGVVEPIIWTVNAGPLKSCTIPNEQLAKVAAGPDDVLECALGFVLRQCNASLSLPNADEFYSATPEPHRKGDKAYHVKAHRGSKDGYLFFLSNGIFFGFKKPLAFFAFEDIESISYTSVLQRTFNLNIAYRTSGGGGDADENPIQEVEFSMLDQADFAGIDEYVKRHGLQDASLAEARRAKKVTTNPKSNSTQNGDPAGEGEGQGEDQDTRTELEKAQQQLDDEEDEEEEDYDPGSEGESEGSGSSDGDDDDDDYERERKKSKGKNLLKEELGSEAEDVSVTEEEDDGEDEDENEDGAEDEGGGDERDVDEEQHGATDRDRHERTGHNNPSARPGIPTIASIPSHDGGWTYQEGMPDPDDEDQL